MYKSTFIAAVLLLALMGFIKPVKVDIITQFETQETGSYQEFAVKYCKDKNNNNSAAFLEIDPHHVLIVICDNTYNDVDTTKSVRHESVHAIQWCLGNGEVIPLNIPAFYTPFGYWDLTNKNYAIKDFPIELEAHYMADTFTDEEIQILLNHFCYDT